MVALSMGSTPEIERALAELDARDRAAHERHDIIAWSELWTDDIVILPPGRSAAVGKPAAIEAFKQGVAFGAHGVVVDWSPIWEETEVAGDYAFQRGCIRAIVKDAEKSVEALHYFNVLRVLRRRADGAWYIHRLCWNNATSAQGAAAGRGD